MRFFGLLLTLMVVALHAVGGSVQRMILKPAEVSDMTTVPVETLKYWRQRGKGPRWFKLGGTRIVYDRDAVESWLDEQRQQGGVRPA